MRRNTPYGQAASLALLAARIAQDVVEFALREAGIQDSPWFQIENFKSQPPLGAEPGTRVKGFEFKLRCVILEAAPAAEALPERDPVIARTMDPEGSALKDALVTVLKKQRVARD